jgi:hypothetical protein
MLCAGHMAFQKTFMSAFLLVRTVNFKVLLFMEWQMKNIPGGLADKMEDWAKCLHQWGMQQRRHFHTVQKPLICAMA